jgi:hypothetical protein
MNLPKKGFVGFFPQVKVVEVKQGKGEAPGNQLVTFQFLDGGTAYFNKGDLFTATFHPIKDEDAGPVKA